MKFMKKNGGFTLVELIVVIAILAILAAIAVPAYSGYISKANEAADQQLLAAVNTAFAAACLENGEDAISLKDGSVVFDTETMTVTAPTKYTEAFNRYFSANANAGSAFKVIEHLRFEKGVFTDNTEGIQNLVVRIEGSNYAGNIPTLTGSVNNLAGLLGDRIAADGLEELYMGSANMSEEEYNSFMDTYKLTEDSSETEIANATVMYVADKLSGHTANDIYTIMNGDAQNIIGEFGTIPAAAMMYGLMAGYADSDYNEGGFELDANPTGLNDVLTQFGELQKDANFQNYFKNADADKAGADADLDGFLAAMDVVNGYEGSFDLTQEDLFISEDVTNMLNSILGNS